MTVVLRLGPLSRVRGRTAGSPTCPQNCPCQLPKRGDESQRQPSRSIEKVIERRRFARKDDSGRSAERRLANRRLQPLGHLTAERKLSINDIAGYAQPIVPATVPEIVPATDQNRLRMPPELTRRASRNAQRFFSEPDIPPNSGAAGLCSPELAARSPQPSRSARRSRRLRRRTAAPAAYSGLLNRRTGRDPELVLLPGRRRSVLPPARSHQVRCGASAWSPCASRTAPRTRPAAVT